MNNRTNASTEAKPFYSSLFDTVKVAVKVQHTNLFELKRQHPTRIFWKDRHYSVRSRFRGCFAIVASAKGGELLYIEASIPRFLTGQNIVGTEDLKHSSIELIDEVLRRMRITPTSEERSAYRAGHFEFLRVDYANHVWCRSKARAEALMKAVRRQAVGSARDYSAYKAETLYWRQDSKRKSLKAYGKGQQIRRRPLGANVRWAKFLMRKADNMVRFEIVLRSEELTRLNLRTPADWTPEKARDLLNDAVRDVVSFEGKVPDVSGMETLSRNLQDRLELWLRGATDAFTRYPGAFSANRREILKATGIDITSVRTPEEQAQDFVTLRDEFQRGWKFQSWDSRWAALKDGAKSS